MLILVMGDFDLPLYVLVDRVVDEYKSEMVAAGLGYLATSPNGRRLIVDLAKTEVMYRGKQAEIVGNYLARASGLAKGGKFRPHARSVVRAAPKAARMGLKGLSTPALVATVGYAAGTAVGNSSAVQKTAHIGQFMPLGAPV
jgi:hypothetical protein